MNNQKTYLLYIYSKLSTTNTHNKPPLLNS